MGYLLMFSPIHDSADRALLRMIHDLYPTDFREPLNPSREFHEVFAKWLDIAPYQLRLRPEVTLIVGH